MKIKSFARKLALSLSALSFATALATSVSHINFAMKRLGNIERVGGVALASDKDNIMELKDDLARKLAKKLAEKENIKDKEAQEELRAEIRARLEVGIEDYGNKHVVYYVVDLPLRKLEELKRENNAKELYTVNIHYDFDKKTYVAEGKIDRKTFEKVSAEKGESVKSLLAKVLTKVIAREYNPHTSKKALKDLYLHLSSNLDVYGDKFKVNIPISLIKEIKYTNNYSMRYLR